MVGHPEALADAQARFADVAGVEVVDGLFGDIWLRDTGPIFRPGSTRAAAFRFNGWGGKFDDGARRRRSPTQIGAASGVPLDRNDFVLEGGALDHDGQGTVLTTRQCLLNRNRNADWTEEKAEAALAEAIGARKVLWLGDGLLNDHTDGHVDNLARFVAPGVVACPIAWGRGDPNDEVYDAWPGPVGHDGCRRQRDQGCCACPRPASSAMPTSRPVPASHMNFLIANGAVIVPTYGDDRAADLACQGLKTVFPDREIIPLPSIAILTGGGSFHCISQQEPA